MGGCRPALSFPLTPYARVHVYLPPLHGSGSFLASWIDWPLDFHALINREVNSHQCAGGGGAFANEQRARDFAHSQSSPFCLATRSATLPPRVCFLPHQTSGEKAQ